MSLRDKGEKVNEEKDNTGFFKTGTPLNVHYSKENIPTNNEGEVT